MYTEIKAKLEAQVSITPGEALWLHEQCSTENLKSLAKIVRSRYHKPDEATYLVMAIINYTNICVAACDYCSFYRLPHQEGTYTLNFAQLCERIEAVQALGGTLVGFNGGFNPKLSLENYLEMFAKLNQRFPDMTFYEMTVAEFMFVCKKAKISYEEGAHRFAAVGTRWITGGGAEILSDSFRKRHSPGKYTVADYFAAQEAVLAADLNSTATMVIGFDETIEERLDHLTQLREFQTKAVKKLTSFLLWTYKPYNNKLGGTEISPSEYLRWLAICRIFLDNFVHLRASVLTQNSIALEGLLYAANDFDLPTEDEVTQKAGATISLAFDSILKEIVGKGIKPIKRGPF